MIFYTFRHSPVSVRLTRYFSASKVDFTAEFRKLATFLNAMVYITKKGKGDADLLPVRVNHRRYTRIRKHIPQFRTGIFVVRRREKTTGISFIFQGFFELPGGKKIVIKWNMFTYTSISQPQIN